MPWTLTQADTGTHPGPGTASVSFGGSVAAGDLIVIATAPFDGYDTGITDTGTNTYQLLGRTTNGLWSNIELWYAVAKASGAITVMIAGSNYSGVCIADFPSGGGTISVDDAVVTAIGTGSTGTTGPMRIAVPDLVVFAASAGELTGAPFTAGAGFALAGQLGYNSGGNMTVAIGFALNVGSSPVTPSVNYSGPTPWAMVSAAFTTGTPIPATAISAVVARSGHGYFTALSGSTLAPVAIEAVVGVPTVKNNGSVVELGPPCWLNDSFSAPVIAYPLLCGEADYAVVQAGGHNYVTPVAHATGVTFGTATTVNGVITSITATGQDTQGQQLLAGGTGSGFVGYYTVATPGTLSAITVHVERGGSGYGAGTPIFVDGFSQPPGVAFVATLSNGVLSTLPIVSSATGMLAAPAITITDTGGGTGAVAACHMSGPAPSDTVTYSAPAGWITSVLGSTFVITNAAMTNSAGQLEPWLTSITPTMPIGMNFSYPWGVFGGLKNLQQSWLQSAGNWTGATAPQLAFTDGTGSLAIAIGIVNSSGVVTGYTVLCGGSNYSGSVSATCAAPASGGTLAVPGSITVVGGVITAIGAGSGGSGYGGSTLDGRPLSINGTTFPQGMSGPAKPTAWVTVSDQGLQRNSINLQGMPDMIGPFTFSATETNPGSPMTVTFFNQLANVLYSPSPTGSNPKTWTFPVTRGGNPELAGLVLSLVIQGPTAGAACPMTLTNMVLTPPTNGGTAQTPQPSLPLAPDLNGIDWMTTANGGGAAAIRFSLFGANFIWDCGAVVPADLRPAGDFTWADGLQRNNFMVITAIREWWPSASGGPGWHSPYIFTQQAYPNTQPSSGLGAGPWPAPYYWVPPAPVGVYPADWIGPGIIFTAEFTTESPHGLNTGNYVVIPDNGLTGGLPIWDFNTGPTSTSTTNIEGSQVNNPQVPVWVTGFNSFMIAFNYTPFGINESGPHVAAVHGTNAANFLMGYSVIQQGGDVSFPVEACCEAVNAIPDCGFWAFVPIFANDACVDAYFSRILAALTPGRKLYIEWVNEHWNDGSTDYYPIVVMSRLAGGLDGIAIGDNNAWYCQRVGQIQNRAKVIFAAAGREADIVCLYGGQQSNSFSVTPLAGYLNTWNAGSNPAYQADEFAAAAYWNCPTDTAYADAAARTYTNFPGSNKYQDACVWSMGQYMDFVRHLIFYMNGFPYNPLWAGGTNAAAATYNMVPGQTVQPGIVNYECGSFVIVPPGPSATDWMLRSYIAHDAYFHPYNADVEYAFYAALQTAGVVMSMQNPMCFGPGGAAGPSNVVNGYFDDVVTTNYQFITWEGMPYGRGDGSPDQNGNATVNRYFNDTGLVGHIRNVSPKLQGWQDWVSNLSAPLAASAYSLLPASPSGGQIGIASSNFTVQANGIPSVPLVVTPSVSGLAGSFMPPTLTIVDALAHTFVLTPSSAGTGMITVTHTGGGFAGNPAAVVYRASALPRPRPRPWFTGLLRAAS